MAGYGVPIGPTSRSADCGDRRTSLTCGWAPGRYGAPHAEDVVRRVTSLVAREHELDRAVHSLRFSGGVLIIEELVLSMRTVQSHLASAYRKLGIASRSELRS